MILLRVAIFFLLTLLLPDWYILMILLRVAIFFLLMLLLPDWYIHRIYIRCKKSKLYSRLLWWPTIGLLMLLAIFIALHDSLHDYFGIFLIVTLCFCIPKLTFVVFSLVLRAINKVTGLKIPHAAISALPALAMLGYILFGLWLCWDIFFSER